MRDEEAIVGHELYRAPADNLGEARCLCGLLNGAALQVGARRFQGQRRARDFDKYVINLPTPRFDENDELRRRAPGLLHVFLPSIGACSFACPVCGTAAFRDRPAPVEERLALGFIRHAPRPAERGQPPSAAASGNASLAKPNTVRSRRRSPSVPRRVIPRR